MVFQTDLKCKMQTGYSSVHELTLTGLLFTFRVLQLFDQIPDIPTIPVLTLPVCTLTNCVCH